MQAFSRIDVGERQGGMEEQQPSSWGGWDRGAETALGLPECPSHLLCEDFLRKHPAGRMALFGEALHKRHPLLAGELPHQVHSVPVILDPGTEALHLLQVVMLLLRHLCRANEKGQVMAEGTCQLTLCNRG